MNEKSTDFEKLIKKVRSFTKKSVSKSRYEHSLRTAQTAESLCKKFGIPPEKGYFAGVSHDMCKAMPEETLLELSKKDGFPISALEKEKPSLLHGRAAAVMLYEDFGVTDSEILEAVANHTFGKKNMCNLAKILFVADKIEPGREYITSEFMEKLSGLSLNRLTYAVIEDEIRYLNKKNKAVAPETLLLLESLKDEK